MTNHPHTSLTILACAGNISVRVVITQVRRALSPEVQARGGDLTQYYTSTPIDESNELGRATYLSGVPQSLPKPDSKLKAAQVTPRIPTDSGKKEKENPPQFTVHSKRWILQPREFHTP